MCNLQELANPRQRGPHDSNVEGKDGTMQKWPVVEIHAAACSLRGSSTCSGRCGRKTGDLDQQEGVR